MGEMIRRSGIFVLLLLLLAFSMGCGSGRQARPEAETGDVDIDALLAEENQDQQQADEAEVLRLLGITPSEQEKEEGATARPAAVPKSVAPPTAQTPEAQQGQQTDTRLESLKQQVAELEQRLESREETIQNLRAELQQRESQLAQLRAQRQSQMTRTAQVSTRPATGDYKARYQQALEAYYARRYQEAIQMFRALLQEDDRNPLADNAQYWIGESYYGLGNYSQAIAEFEKVFTFPNSNKADDAQLKLGVTYLRLGNRARAREEFERLIANYPDSEYVGTARNYLARLQG